MIVKQVRLSAQAKDKMSRLKGKTGIRNWNILARWAFCYSLDEGTVPAEIDLEYEGGVEMPWQVFAGEYGSVYELLLVDWCRDREIPVDQATLARMFCLHLERGIAYLSGTRFIRGIDDLLALGFEGDSE